MEQQGTTPLNQKLRQKHFKSLSGATKKLRKARTDSTTGRKEPLFLDLRNPKNQNGKINDPLFDLKTPFSHTLRRKIGKVINEEKESGGGIKGTLTAGFNRRRRTYSRSTLSLFYRKFKIENP